MVKARKPNPGSWEMLLSPEQVQQLACWMVDEKLTYAKTKARLREKFNIRMGEASLKTFWDRFCAPRLVQTQLLEEARARGISGAVKINIECSQPVVVFINGREAKIQ